MKYKQAETPDCLFLINKYCQTPQAKKILLQHSQFVMKKATAIASRLENTAIDLSFLREGALLHDIGISSTLAPAIGCTGTHPYIAHGVLGREILEREGFLKHALVCERHTGVGLTVKDIKLQSLPLPKREMVPVSLEEQIICYADKFYSKSPESLHVEKSVESIRNGLSKFCCSKTRQFDAWVELFGP
ncbi:MAG: HDIG domain-containing metalloprotein [Nitrospinota bacterium]